MSTLYVGTESSASVETQGTGPSLLGHSLVRYSGSGEEVHCAIISFFVVLDVGDRLCICTTAAPWRNGSAITQMRNVTFWFHFPTFRVQAHWALGDLCPFQVVVVLLCPISRGIRAHQFGLSWTSFFGIGMLKKVLGVAFAQCPNGFQRLSESWAA